MMGTKLEQCTACRGFVPGELNACPHCSAPVARRSRSLARRVALLGGALGGGAIAFTLMACYGAPPCPDGSRECYKSPASDVEAGSMPNTTPLGGGDGGTK